MAAHEHPSNDGLGNGDSGLNSVPVGVDVEAGTTMPGLLLDAARRLTVRSRAASAAAGAD